MVVSNKHAFHSSITLCSYEWQARFSAYTMLYGNAFCMLFIYTFLAAYCKPIFVRAILLRTAVCISSLTLVLLLLSSHLNWFGSSICEENAQAMRPLSKLMVHAFVVTTLFAFARSFPFLSHRMIVLRRIPFVPFFPTFISLHALSLSRDSKSLSCIFINQAARLATRTHLSEQYQVWCCFPNCLSFRTSSTFL